MAQSSSFPSVLFFIPDIGGFTKFVTETEISRRVAATLLYLADTPASSRASVSA